MRTIAPVVLSLLALFSGGCATTPLYRKYFDAGLYQEAAHALETDSTTSKNPDALLIAARLYSDPALPVYDPQRARNALERLVADFPESSEAGSAVMVLRVVSQVESLQQEVAARTAQLAELESARARADTLAASLDAAERDSQALRRRIQRLEADLEQARQELERLKAIDLRRRPNVRR